MRHFRRWLLVLLAPLLIAADGFCAEPTGESVLLVARKGMRDPRFQETVVLLTSHGRRGTVGVVLNRPLPTTLGQIFPSNRALSKEQDQLYYGGPVSLDSLVFVFRAPVMAREALHVTDDVYLSMSPEILAGLLRRDAPTQDLRVFRGYAGWAPGQIEAEIARGDWHVLAAEPDVIFSEEPDRLWEEMIIRATALQARAQPDGYAASIAAR